MTDALKNIKTEYLVLAPMIPMVVHIYSFFVAYDHWIIAAAVAATFDITLFLLFKYLRTREIRRDKAAYRSLWLAIIIMTAFQLYANIRVYWSVQPGLDAIVMGSIFPLMFGFLSFISARLEHRVESYRPAGHRQNGQAGESLPDPNRENRELCERIFPEHPDKTEAVKAAVEAGVPESSAYRYYKRWRKKGSLL